jgi:hypothetical protein
MSPTRTPQPVVADRWSSRVVTYFINDQASDVNAYLAVTQAHLT